MKVLFICTGNMCRSPAAEKLLALYGGAAGFETRSRGTAAQPYCKMPRQITEFLTKQGVSSLEHKPALAGEADIDWADLILVMEGMHRDILADKFPQSMRKTQLFLDYVGESGDLRDPMGKSDKVFEEVLQQIQEAIKKIVSK
ncbi:MAG: hypothetical protein PHV36_02240 [Elusimicrobiales bacterium]|nr:hypothetical protein [Elusimicrobiales bacterium]